MTQTLTQQAKRLIAGNAKMGATLLEFIPRAISHAVAHGDSTPMAVVIGGLDPADSLRWRKILMHVVSDGHIEIKRDASQPSGYLVRPGKGLTWSDVTVKGNVIPVMNDLIRAKASFRSKSVQDSLFDAKPAADWDTEQRAKVLARGLVKNHVSLDVAIAALTAAYRAAEVKG
jgi:hypothetical protein